MNTSRNVPTDFITTKTVGVRSYRETFSSTNIRGETRCSFSESCVSHLALSAFPSNFVKPARGTCACGGCVIFIEESAAFFSEKFVYIYFFYIYVYIYIEDTHSIINRTKNTVMLGKQMSDSKEKDRDNNVSKDSKCKLFVKWTPPREKHLYFRQRFGSPRMIRSFPQRKRSLSYYKTRNFSTFDVVNVKGDASVFVSPKSSLGNSFQIDSNKLSRELSRSAKIMKALTSSSSSLSHRHRSIRKSLNFSPNSSPRRRNNSSSIGSDSLSLMIPEKVRLDSTSTDSSASMLIASIESIDENQNQTPQHSRKITNTLTDTTPKIAKTADTATSKLKLRSKLKERIDSLVNTVETPRNSFSKSNIDGCVILASTPRELSHDINQDENNRSQTPENIMLIPQTMSAIKKSHKKEKLNYFEDLLSTQQMEVSIANTNLHINTTKSLELHDASDSFYNMTPIKESQKKKKDVKKMLTYKDSGLNDTRSLLIDHDAENTTLNKDYLENRSDKSRDDEIQNIDLNVRDVVECEKTALDSNVDLTNCDDEKGESDWSEKTNSEKKESQLSSQEKASREIDATSERKTASPERESTSFQNNNNAATTPDNHINLVKQICTESIKKSHKKVKYEKRKALSQRQIFHQTMEIDKTSAEDTDRHKDEANDNNATTTPTSTRQNSGRPVTPEVFNSSRLLLSQFYSIKKSHKKDKEKKEKVQSSAIERHKYSKINSNSKGDGETSTDATSRSNESLQLADSLGVLFKKGKRSLRMSLYDNRKSTDADDEFKIYTPIKRRPLIPLANSAKPCQEKNKLAEATPGEIDCFRCTTPVARHCESTSEKSRESETHSHSNDELADIGNQTHGNGASTPTNISSTTELRHNIDSIKASHKKEKLDRSGVCRKQILEKKQRYTIKNISFADMADTSSEDHPLENDVSYAEGTCSNTCGDNVDKNREGISREIFASRAENISKNPIPAKELKSSVVATPPNDSNIEKLIRLSHTTSIKKSHKKERDNNAQAKYIFMSEEHDLSDDGSIFNEEDRLSSGEFQDLCHDNEMINNSI